MTISSRCNCRKSIGATTSPKTLPAKSRSSRSDNIDHATESSKSAAHRLVLALPKEASVLVVVLSSFCGVIFSAASRGLLAGGVPMANETTPELFLPLVEHSPSMPTKEHASDHNVARSNLRSADSHLAECVVPTTFTLRGVVTSARKLRGVGQTSELNGVAAASCDCCGGMVNAVRLEVFGKCAPRGHAGAAGMASLGDVDKDPDGNGDVVQAAGICIGVLGEVGDIGPFAGICIDTLGDSGNGLEGALPSPTPLPGEDPPLRCGCDGNTSTDMHRLAAACDGSRTGAIAGCGATAG
mmetsp:Transcript_57917/g.167901  ORF Transcript_57917/g.167901 Transcript_57917/m.167901 type:complete len:298 (+) Transcript_57917:648-1541(+)